MFDVIVVGAGPAGSAAAKRCASQGLETLLLEKRTMPRDKVCDGMIMGPVPRTLIKEEFGDIPDDVLTRPRSIDGYVMHVPGIDRQTVENFTLLTWRRNLDNWLARRAQAGGAKIRQGTRVTGVSLKGKGFLVNTVCDEEAQELETRFIVGADGAVSPVRKALLPGARIACGQVYQECYQCDIDLDKTYFHWFYPVEYSPGMFCAHHKDGLLQLDYGGRTGSIGELVSCARDYLARNHGFDPGLKPVRRGGCMQPTAFRDLIARNFLPARGNALLAGEAGGFVLPVSGEGIGTALRTGLAAGNAIATAVKSGTPPDSHYLKEIEPVLQAFDEILPWFKKIVTETRAGGRSLSHVLADAYSATLRPF